MADVQGGAKVPIDLPNGEVAVEFIGLKDGGLLFTTIDGELHARTITSTLSLVGGVVLEENWGGELAVYQRDDGLVQVAWTPTFFEPRGLHLHRHRHDVHFRCWQKRRQSTTTCQRSNSRRVPTTDSRLTSTTAPWSLQAIIRDLSTSGSWQDITSLFVISSASPDKGNSWTSPLTVLSDIDIRPGDAQPLAVGLGGEYLHILYQEYRDDVSASNESA